MLNICLFLAQTVEAPYAAWQLYIPVQFCDVSQKFPYGVCSRLLLLKDARGKAKVKTTTHRERNAFPFAGCSTECPIMRVRTTDRPTSKRNERIRYCMVADGELTHTDEKPTRTGGMKYSNQGFEMSVQLGKFGWVGIHQFSIIADDLFRSQ